MKTRAAEDDPIEEMKGCVCSALRRTARAVTQMYDRTLKAHGIRATQTPILVAAWGAEPVPLGRVAENLGMERTTLLRNLRPLVRRGLVEQSTESGSPRTMLKTTPAGRALLKRAYPDWRKVQTRALDLMGRTEWSRSLTAFGEVSRGAERR
jgi:DNA-binding MarR family transcriptional regulator